MVNNDVIKKLRYILDYSDDQMIEVFGIGLLTIELAELKSWLIRDDDASYEVCEDRVLASFLNGLIVQKRGELESGVPKAEDKLTYNIVLRKLMIAFGLKTGDVIEVLKLADLRVGKSEISAFFRKKTHRNYRECKSQVLRNFLMGLQFKLRPKS